MKNANRKTFFIATICLLFVNYLCAQKDTTNVDTLKIIDSIKVDNTIFRTVYYNNGNKFSQGEIKNEKKNGLWIYYYKNGKKKSEGNYKNGKENGSWIYYYENGQKKTEGKYRIPLFLKRPFDARHMPGTPKRGKYTGSIKYKKWTYWYQNGNVQEVDLLRRGYLRKSSIWDDQGNIIVINQKCPDKKNNDINIGHFKRHLKKSNCPFNYDPQHESTSTF